MARKRHSPEFIAGLLRRAEFGVPIATLAREASVHENARASPEEAIWMPEHAGDSRDKRAAW